jgi:ABC-type sugar transport system substrate-binding protein
MIVIVGCRQVRDPSSKSGGEMPPASRGVIGLSVLTLTHPFFKVIADTVVAEAAPHGYQVAVVSGEFDVATQQN